MSGPLILSIFPGIDMLGRAFEEEWPEACVVRGPDLIFGGDIKTFHPPAGRFDGVIGGPPCQAFSRLRHLVEHNGYAVAENLIPEFERVVSEAEPEWWLMENVPDAPVPTPYSRVHPPGWRQGSVVLNNRDVGAEQNRERRITVGVDPRRHGFPTWIQEVGLFTPQAVTWEPAVCASGGARPGPVRIGGSGKVKRSFTERHRATRKGASAMGFKTEAYYREALRLQGLPPNFLEHAPLTVAGKIKVVGNGVPLAMGRALARAVRQAMTP